MVKNNTLSEPVEYSQCSRQDLLNKIKELQEKFDDADNVIRQYDYISDQAGREISALKHKIEDLESNIAGLTGVVLEFKKRSDNGNV